MEQTEDLTVGAMAKGLDKCVDTVRELDRRGVIQSRRDSTNRRIYGRDQLDRALAHYAKRAVGLRTFRVTILHPAAPKDKSRPASYGERAEANKPTTPEGFRAAALEMQRNGLTHRDISHVLRIDVNLVQQLLRQCECC